MTGPAKARARVGALAALAACGLLAIGGLGGAGLLDPSARADAPVPAIASPAELRILQSLRARRMELERREQTLSTQLALIAAAEGKFDARIAQLNAAKAEIVALMVAAERLEAEESARLVRVYERMRPSEAAPILARLDDRVRLPVAAGMKETSLAMILARMTPAEAQALTERLADRGAARTAIVHDKADAALAGPERKAGRVRS